MDPQLSEDVSDIPERQAYHWEEIVKILAIDQSRLMLRAIEKAIKERGYRFVFAENGAGGLAKIRKHGRDTSLIILEDDLPLISGVEVLQRVRSDSNYGHIAVLMTSDDGNASSVKRAINAGADSYLMKPFSREQLMERIDQILAAKQRKGVYLRQTPKPSSE